MNDPNDYTDDIKTAIAHFWDTRLKQRSSSKSTGIQSSMSKLEKKSKGGFYTEKAVACYMLDMCGFRADRDLRNISILEPSAGEGVFALEILRRLYTSSEQFAFSFEQALCNLLFVELDRATAQKLIASISSFSLKDEQVKKHYHPSGQLRDCIKISYSE